MLTNLITAFALTLLSTSAIADKPPAFTRTQDVIYDRQNGTALTMDVFEPLENANGATVVWVISGGWFSSHDSISAKAFSPVPNLIEHGYKVCAVVHRSTPYYTIEHAVADIERAIRFARYSAQQDGWTTTPIGIVGGSAGGHLSLMAGTTGDDGDPKAKDPVERTSSRIQAVACFFPPTDFLNYGDTNVNVLKTTVGEWFRAPFDFQKQDPPPRPGFNTGRFEDVTDPDKINSILKEVSPITHVSPDDAPTLIIQGDKDLLVPMQQAESFIEKLKDASVDAKLIRRPGKGHGWASLKDDNELLADWMDEHLLAE